MGRMGQYGSVGQWVMGQWEWVKWVSGSVGQIELLLVTDRYTDSHRQTKGHS